MYAQDRTYNTYNTCRASVFLFLGPSLPIHIQIKALLVLASFAPNVAVTDPQACPAFLAANINTKKGNKSLIENFEYLL